MAAIDDFAIVSISTSMTSQFKLIKSAQEADVVLTELGKFGHACLFNEETMFEAEGSGDFPTDFAVPSAGPTIVGLTGGVSLVDSGDENQATGSPNAWSAKGEHAPNAIAAA